MLTEILAPSIVAAAPAERADVLATITAAFEGDPACRAFWPDRAAFRRHFPRFVELFGGPAEADRTRDGLGAALWLAPGVEPDPEPLMAHLEATLPADRKAALLAGLERQAALHPHAPHWYLPFIGVRAEARGRGIGGALLAHRLARADRDGLPAYLEATSRRGLALYRRHGFEVTGVVESPGYPEIFAMWRPARRIAR
jgi:ribosomal protein S18 acetylase RimI-like enzyme